MKIGIIREGKNPPDKRVALSPTQCKEVMQQYPTVQIAVQPSPVRCFKDEEYAAEGCQVTENLDDCNVLMGIKEVPIAQLIADKTYLFFSHTIKKQPYNRKLLQTILAKNINLIDYETLKNPQGERIVAFGRYAGLVGAYNAVLAYGKKYQLFDLKPAHQLFDRKELDKELQKINLPPIKIALTGNGRVTKGAIEMLEAMKIRKVDKQDYLTKTFDAPVYVQLRSADYHFRKGESKTDGTSFGSDFYTNPENYGADFSPFYRQTDVLIATAYWNPKAPLLFQTADTQKKDFRIRLIADVTCDINGSIPTTTKASTIIEPLYDFDCNSLQTQPFAPNPDHITVMAVDNLPCEMPRDASVDFGKDLINRVLPSLLIEDKEQIIANAFVTKKGVLQPNFMYLENYVMQMA